MSYITQLLYYFNWSVEYNKYRIYWNELSEEDSIFENETFMFDDRGIFLLIDNLTSNYFVQIVYSNCVDTINWDDVVKTFKSIPTPFSYIRNHTFTEDKLNKVSTALCIDEDEAYEKWAVNSKQLFNWICYKNNSSLNSENINYFVVNNIQICSQKKQNRKKIEQKLLKCKKSRKLADQK